MEPSLINEPLANPFVYHTGASRPEHSSGGARCIFELP